MKDTSNPYCRNIDGITFIDTVALNESVATYKPTKHKLRQIMINAGVRFWDDDQTIIQKPVVGISSVGSFHVCLAPPLAQGHIKLRMGETIIGPISVKDIADGLRESMGMQSIPSFMNPQGKSPLALQEVTLRHRHFSIAHGATLGMVCLGMSTKAELEFDVQRDMIHVARETSARAFCQSEPTLVAMTQEGAEISKKILSLTIEALSAFPQNADKLDWLEEKNALYPKSSAVYLGINSTCRNLQKLVADIGGSGKELEYRNILALMNDSLHAMFSDLFKPTSEYGHKYPKEWSINYQSQPKPSTQGIFSAQGADIIPIPKKALHLLGAPGVGKSTQTKALSTKVSGVMCISTGNLVRALLAKVEANEKLTLVEQEAAKSLDNMKQGKLMDDDAVYALLMAHLSANGDGHAEFKNAHTIVFDGVIKESRNIEPFNRALAAFNKANSKTPIEITGVAHLGANRDALIQRHNLRVQEALDNGNSVRPDDAMEVYTQRVQRYLDNVDSLLNYFQTLNDITVQEIDTSKSIDDTSTQLLEFIRGDQTRPMSAISSRGGI